MQKILLVTLCFCFRLALTLPNYANPGGAGDWINYDRCRNAPAGFYKSPIFVKDSSCTDYSSFSLSLPDENAGGTFADKVRVESSFGAPERFYPGGSLTLNDKVYTSDVYLVRTKSEHVLYTTGTHADAEIQVFFESGPESIALAFLIREIPQDSTAPIYESSPYAKLLSSVTTSNWQLNFKELAERITNHQKYEVFLNMYLYPGTYTYQGCETLTWLVFGQELYATKEVLDIIRAHTSTVTNAATTGDGDYNARPYTGIGGGSGEQAVTKLCNLSSFSAHLKLIPGILIVLAFLMFNVLGL